MIRLVSVSYRNNHREGENLFGISILKMELQKTFPTKPKRTRELTNAVVLLSSSVQKFHPIQANNF